ncbi:hypothetical protein ACFFLM_12185 [Deinococcus oregonensis]|uniref:Lipoprotein n=1 Tax=Deinococcus oregonensis TaxID=1805970 RepID=A0ABV6AZ12_9DEIO
MKFFFLLTTCFFLNACTAPANMARSAEKLSQAQEKAAQAEARADMASLRINLMVASIDGGNKALEVMDCDDARLGEPRPLELLKLTQCKAQIISDSDYTIAAEFNNGFAFVADQDGVRQVEVTALPVLN